MLVLGIESSCDETGVAVCRVGEDVAVSAAGGGFMEIIGSRASLLIEKLSSQASLHRNYGGVVPELASREHLKNLPILYEEVLRGSGLTLKDIDLIAVTAGPGLLGALLVGVNFAKGLAAASGKRLVAVNHIEGHIWSPLLSGATLRTPFLSLIVSGGHTELVKVSAFGEYQLLERTRDDAAGEAFDKIASLVGFEYPGGCQLAALAEGARTSRYLLPKVMVGKDGFSFSGLKTAAIKLTRDQPEILVNERLKAEFCFAVERAICEPLIAKTLKHLASGSFGQLLVVGGVSANNYLRDKMVESVKKEFRSIEVIFPEKKYCGDNGAMIALLGGLKASQGITVSDLAFSPSASLDYFQ
ncbi:MAG TPA: tRNA (adenosine(37)-N6)-threonylcarbamoyltransferase complex transferase subunit TsaD [Oligoflexia bacterium]|nr:tRNA (adenosine(37)-N6)-threonylcarbamoyltransferase complex transferase subunit TsaD [Oligoflexia bacterium]HMP26578.1 tRNA (adenosine(37)-N6)-threonylcarbamoyltransferase complex transferase subunit TsaD [Oligoflexia bacterium]